ncbi:MAG: FGGY-family carbohydrate kinase, partial [Actinomycetota bacterium]
ALLMGCVQSVLDPGINAAVRAFEARVRETAPAGAGNVVFTPWLAGERTPISDRHARAGFQNLGLGTTSAHLARAVLEGVAMNSRWLLQEAERFTSRRLEPIRIIGGGAQSPLWCQIMADVTNRTIEQVIDPRNANLRGMALFTARSLGLVQQDEIRGLVAIQQTFEPNPEHRSTYDTLFEAFTTLYTAQKKLFRLLNP